MQKIIPASPLFNSSGLFFFEYLHDFSHENAVVVAGLSAFIPALVCFLVRVEFRRHFMRVNLLAYKDEIGFFYSGSFVTDEAWGEAASFELVSVASGMGSHVAFLRLVGNREDGKRVIVLAVQDRLGETALPDIDRRSRFRSEEHTSELQSR